MRWFTVDKEHFKGYEYLNPTDNTHVLRLSANTKVRQEDDSNEQVRYILKYTKFYPTLTELKDILVSLQKEYDNGVEVNSFYLNGNQVWLDKATRVGLFSVLNLEKESGKETTTLWFNNQAIDIEVNKAITLLTAVEMYAKQCYDNTQAHLNAIDNLETVEDGISFDITAGYPDKLRIELE